MAGVGAGFGACCPEIPNKSFEAFATTGFVVGFGGLEAKLKSPKSSLGMLNGFGA